MVGNAGGQGGNSAIVRQFNARVILAALRRVGEASKADLARHVSLTQNAAGQIVRELERQNLVCPTGKRTGQRGQPATLLCLDPDGAYAIGIKLGRRSLDSLLIDFTGHVLASRRHERAFPPPDEALRIVLADIAELRATLPPERRARLAGVGLAMPYNLGSWQRELDVPEDVGVAWSRTDFGAQLRRNLDLPVFVENDGTAIAVAELFQGHGREIDDFAVVYIGTAAGGGVVLGGDYRRGLTGNAGDMGMMPVAPSRLASARPPSGGRRDILLNRASVGTLIRHFRCNDIAVDTGAELDAAIAAYPALYAEWQEDCADALIDPLLAIGSLLDLQAIVIDGNLPRPCIEALLARLRRLLDSNVAEACTPPTLRLGTVGRNAAALGAAILPLHLNYGPDRQILFRQ